MARRKPTTKTEQILFDVLYEDGTQSSNRKISSEIFAGFEVEDVVAREEIERQDREISERSGKPRPPIKSLARVKKKKAKKVA